jgi:hypothetical protein
MNRPHSIFRRFSLVPVLLLLLLPLAACGGGPDQGEQVQNAETPAPPAPGQAQGGGRRGAKGHVTLTGALSFDGDVPVSCGVASNQGLEVIFNPNEGEASQVQVQIESFNGPGNYPATFVMREGGTARRWNGTAQVDIQSRDMGKKGGKRTALSGTLKGSYKGEGQGTIDGSFRRCVVRDQA